jgi:hypothetical protein
VAKECVRRVERTDAAGKFVVAALNLLRLAKITPPAERTA